LQGPCNVRGGNLHLEDVRFLSFAVGSAERDALWHRKVRCLVDFVDTVAGKGQIDTALVVLPGDLDMGRRPIRPNDEASSVFRLLMVESLSQRDQVVA